MKKSKLSISLCILLCLSMVFCSSVFAGNEEPQPDSYRVTYRAEPITDTDELVALAASQNNNRNSSGRKLLNQPSDSIVAEQLIEKREYASGKVEEEYLATSITAYDASLAPIMPRSSESKLEDAYAGGYGIATVVQLSYTASYNLGTGNPPYSFTFKYIRGKLLEKDFDVSVNLELSYKHTDSNWSDHSYSGKEHVNISKGIW